MQTSSEDKIKMSKECVDSFVQKFDDPEAEATKKFVLAFFQILLDRGDKTDVNEVME